MCIIGQSRLLIPLQNYFSGLVILIPGVSRFVIIASRLWGLKRRRRV
jgi:hypothetical protein